MEVERAFAMKISRGLIVATEDDTTYDIACLMNKHNIGAVVIVRGEDLVGIISERDIVRRIVTQKLEPGKILAKDIMTKEVITGNLDDGLDKIYEILCKAPFRHLPIMEGSKLVGIVSKRDVLYSVKPKKD
jgi:CBS domain-containing protein